MALREPYRQVYLSLSNATQVTALSPAAGEGFKVRRISIMTPPAGSPGDPVFVSIVVGATTVQFWRIDKTYGNHLGYLRHGVWNDSLFSYLVAKGIMPPIPVAQGESLVLEFSDPYTGGVLIEYEVWDAGDVNNTAPLGSKSNETYYVLYGTNATAISTSGYTELTGVFNPTEFTRFPFGDKVPPNTTIEILACLAQTVGRYVDSSNYAITNYLKFIRGSTELFSYEKRGLVLSGGYGATAGYYYGTGFSTFNAHREDRLGEIKFFNPSLVFGPGEELHILVGVGVVGTNAVFEPGTIDVPLLIHKKVAG